MNIHPYALALAAVLAAAMLPSCNTSSTTHPPLVTAGKVDIQRYAGRWYEQFRLPNNFQQDSATAEAQYTLQEDGTVRVLNTESRRNGSRSSATGTATPVPGSDNSRLRVKFDGLASIVPAAAEGNYWIIKLAPDYSAALVGTPDRKYLWMLSRSRKIPDSLRQEYLQEAKRQGFETSRLIHRRR